MSTDEILRHFMQHRYEKAVRAGQREYTGAIARVELEEDMDYGWSEYTPGSGWTLYVWCYSDDGRRVYTESHGDAIPFIHELCQFAVALRP